MKSTILIVALFFMSFHIKAQTNIIEGKITSVKPFFADEFALTVEKSTLILLVDTKDKNTKNFEINTEYKDLLIERKGKYILNPKYAHKILTINYELNGKGWKCIKTIEPIKTIKPSSK